MFLGYHKTPQDLESFVTPCNWSVKELLVVSCQKIVRNSMKFYQKLTWKICGIITKFKLNLKLNLKLAQYRMEKMIYSLPPSLPFLPFTVHLLSDVLIVLTGVFYHKLHQRPKTHPCKLLKPPSDGDNGFWGHEGELCIRLPTEHCNRATVCLPANLLFFSPDSYFCQSCC